ncbi:uncharacterized protein J7T54_005137 [Emericellopsis cladophorae]|uniref:Alkyl hydroperoxide reductase subunit C/ Thiol specific antioxidant domain-containing protein n=1 Tax=Emericellopsis cladophorae TaxID=2686198 RepID=A0A9Q0BE08_9HYPO|nr:uncharacterized protein J7T54_005137 [Emericellopsis cladophorae]KAI6781927.1 hypothetical protein J7T54_005137 [Emericellopsis cladophorae]
MLSSLGTKVALKKVGLPSSTFDLSTWSAPPTGTARREPNKLRKKQPTPEEEAENGWASWMGSWNVQSLPLTISPWFAPPPPPVHVARVPNVGDKAPVDSHARLKLGGKRTLVVFLRCVGCAFAQKTFLALRSIANRHVGTIRCVAVSHSSPHATKKWIDMIGGAWDVEVLIDEQRSLYASWGLGLGNFMYLFHPAAQAQAWKEKGWLGDEVAAAVTRTSAVAEEDEGGVLGNKWQEAGAFAVDTKGTVVWGGKATRSDDMMNLDEGAMILML